MKKHWFSGLVISIAIAQLFLIRHCAEQHHVRFGGWRVAEESAP